MSIDFEAEIARIQKARLQNISAAPQETKNAELESYDQRLTGIEKNIEALGNLILTKIHADQEGFVPQAPAPASIPAAAPIAFASAPVTLVPTQMVRVFPYKFDDNSIGAKIALVPTPEGTYMGKSSHAFTPGQIKNVYELWKRDPVAFGQHIEASYRESIPYQYKKKKN